MSASFVNEGYDGPKDAISEQMIRSFKPKWVIYKL